LVAQTFFNWNGEFYSNSPDDLAISRIFPVAKAKFKTFVLDDKFGCLHKSFHNYAGNELFFNFVYPSDHLFGVLMGKPFNRINQ